MVTKENFEEFVLLYVDKELTDAEEKALLDYVRQHPELKSELQAYTNTTIAPDDAIIFKDKGSLLQTEPKATIINLRKYRVFYALAAGIAALLFVLLLKDNSKHVTIAQNNITNKKETHSTVVHPALEVVLKEPSTVTKNTVIANIKDTPQIHQQKESLAKATASLPSAKEAIDSVIPAPLEMITYQIRKTSEAYIADLDVEPAITCSYSPTITVATPSYFEKNVAPLIALSESAEGLNEISKIVNNKINNIKTTANQLKGSDVKLKIGNKEILIAKL